MKKILFLDLEVKADYKPAEYRLRDIGSSTSYINVKDSRNHAERLANFVLNPLCKYVRKQRVKQPQLTFYLTAPTELYLFLKNFVPKSFNLLSKCLLEGSIQPIISSETELFPGMYAKRLAEIEIGQVQEFFRSNNLPAPTFFRLSSMKDLEWKLAHLQREGFTAVIVPTKDKVRGTKVTRLGNKDGLVIYQSRSTPLSTNGNPLGIFETNYQIHHRTFNLQNPELYKEKGLKEFKKFVKQLVELPDLAYEIRKETRLPLVHFDELKTRNIIQLPRQYNKFQLDYLHHLAIIVNNKVLTKLPNNRIISHLFHPYVLDLLESSNDPRKVKKLYSRYASLRNILTDLGQRAESKKKIELTEF